MKLPSLPRLQNVKTKLDTAWGLLCLLGVPSLCTLTGFWYLEPAHGATVKSRYMPTVYVQAGELTQIVSEVEITVPSQKLVYQLVLMDSKGEYVYKWPTIKPPDGRLPVFEDLLLQIPHQVGIGEYQLAAAVTYVMNPIKNDTIQIKIAKINIDNPPQYVLK